MYHSVYYLTYTKKLFWAPKVVYLRLDPSGYVCRRVPPAEVSVGVNSKEKLLRFRLFNKDTCFVILVSPIAIMSTFF